MQKTYIHNKNSKLTMRLIKAIVYLILMRFSNGDESSHEVLWGYTNGEGLMPNEWGHDFQFCNGRKQSPISIVDSETVYNSSLPPLILQNYAQTPGNVKFYLMNNGHTVFCGIESSDDPIRVTWMEREYVAFSFHFHWGEKNSAGSEHTINNHNYPIEVHIVHYLKEYGTFQEASNHSDGLLVWANFYEIDPTEADNIQLANILNYFPYVTDADIRQDINPLPVSFFVPEESAGEYYYYQGSLTTPECNEDVTWIINHKVMKISSRQVERFRHFHGHNYTANPEELRTNIRPTQPLNGRTVYKNFLNSSISFTQPNILALNLCLMVSILITHLLKL